MIFKLYVIATLLSPCSSLLVQGQPNFKIEITSDHSNAVYNCGENAVLKIAVMQEDRLVNNGTLKIKLSNDGGKELSAVNVDIARQNPYSITVGLNHPGFIQCSAIYGGQEKLAAVAFSPQKINTETPYPADFLAFWNNGIKKLETIPLDLKMEPLSKFSTTRYECFRISLANIENTRIYGFLSVPKGSGPFPALITVEGAGPGYFEPETKWVEKGVLVLRMNVHRYEPPTDQKAIGNLCAKLEKETYYCYHGAPDREKYYFRQSILGINRAINYLASRRDIDKTHMVMQGSSQGGAFALIMAGLNSHITAAAANVPGLCDHYGLRAGRSPGWPRLLIKSANNTVMAPYYDTVNFAKNISCPVIVGVGFVDTTCSPSSVYAAYNTLKTPKMIFNEPTMGHAQSIRYTEYTNKWLAGQLGLDKVLPPTVQ